MEIKINVEIPEGYEATGEFRHVWNKELYIGDLGEAVAWSGPHPSIGSYLILRKKKWKPRVNQDYWTISYGERRSTLNEAYPSDDRIIEAGLAFPSQEKAEEALKRITAFLETQPDLYETT